MNKISSLLRGLCAALCLAMVAIPLGAQPTHVSQPGRGFGPGYNATHETTLNGTVQEVLTHHPVGSPAGTHLMVAGPQGMVDVHIGSFLTKDTREALHVGLPIQVVGAEQTLHGRQYLLARQIIFGGRLVTVRSSNGFLVPAISHRRASSRSRSAKSLTNGGAR
jgi:hypothetical protein